MTKINIHVEKENMENTGIPVENATLPSDRTAVLHAYRNCDRTQLNFTRIPMLLANIFDTNAKELGMTRKEYLYHLLRETPNGKDIPEYDKIHSLKRSL